jgi:quinol monooxygenase YgiN
MHISLLVSGVGAIVAAIGGGVLLARCLREPRGDLAAFSVALLGLLVSLGSQAVGYLSGFDGAMFRAMELGGQVIAPLALILGLSEIAAKSTPVRFCARLYIPALALIAVVVLSLDQLAVTTFSKTWPDPAVVYQTPPNYVLEFAVGPLTALITVIAVGVVLQRAGQPSWNAVLPAQLVAGAAALLLAYPALAELAAYEAKIHLPVASAFAPLEAVAAALTWLAGSRAGRVPLASGRRERDDDAWRHDSDEVRDFGRFEPAADGGVYRGGGLYREDQSGRAGARRYELDDDDRNWRNGRPDRYDNGRSDGYDEDWAMDSRAGAQSWRDGPSRDDWRADQHGSGYEAPDYATGDVATGDFVAPNYVTDDFVAPGYASPGGNDPRAGGWQSRAASEPDRYASEADRFGGTNSNSNGDADGRRAQLFGQIAIFTLLEDRVEEFDELTHRVVEQVRSREPDTLVFIVHAVPSAPMQRILYEVYRDQSAYQRHNQQRHVRQFEADKRPYVLATNVIELGLQQAKVSPFPSVSELFSEPGYDTAGFERPDYLRDYGRTSAQPGSSREYR